MTPETQRLLYADETGELEGVFEVQLMDPVPAERIPELRALLGGDDLVAWSDGLRVLVGWGDLDGLAEAERIVASGEHPFGGIHTHRLYGVDLWYDNLAMALALGVSHNGLPHDRVRMLAGKLLAISTGDVFFREGLERLVSGLDDMALVEPMEQALVTLAETDRRKGADLLPALATMDPDRAMTVLNLFREPDGSFTNDTALGVAYALGRIHTAESRRALEAIAARDDLRAANDIALETLQEWDDPRSGSSTN